MAVTDFVHNYFEMFLEVPLKTPHKNQGLDSLHNIILPE